MISLNESTSEHRHSPASHLLCLLRDGSDASFPLPQLISSPGQGATSSFPTPPRAPPSRGGLSASDGAPCRRYGNKEGREEGHGRKGREGCSVSIWFQGRRRHMGPVSNERYEIGPVDERRLMLLGAGLESLDCPLTAQPAVPRGLPHSQLPLPILCGLPREGGGRADSHGRPVTIPQHGTARRKATVDSTCATENGK